MTTQYTFKVDLLNVDIRLDAFLSKNTPFSRSQVQRTVETKGVRINDQIIKRVDYRLKIGEKIDFVPSISDFELTPEPIPLDIIYEDDHLIVINKPSGLVVHPAPGHFKGTLVHALLYHHPELSGIGEANRPGIVHRLDKGTSGIIIVAKNGFMYSALTKQFKRKEIEKEYLAIVSGIPNKEEGIIDFSLGRHLKDRKRISIKTKKPRMAQTFWRLKETFKNSALLLCIPKTGRTHQIRVHLSAIGCPIIGDPIYLRKARINKLKSRHLKTCLKMAKRPMLHASKIGLFHPIKGSFMQFEARLPQDMNEFIHTLRALNDA